MTTTLINASKLTAALSAAEYLSPTSSNPLPTIDLSSDSTDQAFETLSSAASTTGTALITNLAAKPPIASIQRLFSTLYTNPAPLTPLIPHVKTTIDLSVTHLQKLRELDPALVDDLGQDFEDVLTFYEVVEMKSLPLLMQATSRIVGSDLAPMHENGNNNLRLIDYFQSAEPTGPRCGEHRDYGTYTVWIQVPANVDAVVSWGWCGAILSNNRVKASKHRVLRTQPVQKRRTTVVVFVAPDLDVTLKPVEGSIKGNQTSVWSEQIMAGNISVRDFKEVISKKWRRREGNEEGEVIEGAQDKEVLSFVSAA